MHTFDPKTGWSCFEFSASAAQQPCLVGDFNGWGRVPLPMHFDDGRWVVRVRLQAGRYEYSFQVRDGVYARGVAEVPLCFQRMDDAWLKAALHACTCGKHFWKWN